METAFCTRICLLILYFDLLFELISVPCYVFVCVCMCVSRKTSRRGLLGKIIFTLSSELLCKSIRKLKITGVPVRSRVSPSEPGFPPQIPGFPLRSRVSPSACRVSPSASQVSPSGGGKAPRVNSRTEGDQGEPTGKTLTACSPRWGRRIFEKVSKINFDRC